MPRLRRCTDRFCDFGSALESLEARRCLSASAAVAVPSPSISASHSDFVYTRTGNVQNAGPMQGQGGVALEGGGTDVDQAFQWMIGRMGGAGDFLVLRSSNDTLYNPYIFGFGGTNSVATLDIPSQTAALDPAVKQIIESADAIFIGGGDQSQYVNFWTGTGVQQAIADDISRGVPIGGTSAGTDVIGQFIYSAEHQGVTSDKALANPFNRNVTLAQNFISPDLLPFLSNTIVDTHFETRDRTGRMTAFLARIDQNGWSPDNEPRGIGINEQTVLLITPDGQAQVIGNAGAASTPDVNFFETPGPAQVCVKGLPLTYAPILVDRLTIGGSFNLSDWNASWQINNAFTSHSTITVTRGTLTETPNAVQATVPTGQTQGQLERHDHSPKGLQFDLGEFANLGHASSGDVDADSIGASPGRRTSFRGRVTIGPVHL